MAVSQLQFRKSFAVATALIVTLSAVMPVNAAILFQDDTFSTVESTSIQVGSNDTGAADTSIQFGADSSASENGNITWNVSTNYFSLDHRLDVNGSITASSTLNASNGFTQTTGALNLTATSGALSLSGLSASSISTGSNALNFTSSNFNTTATGINSTAIGATTSSTGAFTTLSASSLTLTTPLSLANGGTNNNITADNGAIVYSDASKFTLLGSTATAGKVLQSGASAAPTWSTPTYPSSSGSTGKILRSDGTNNIYSTATFPDTAGTAGNILRSDGTNFVSTAVTSTQSSPADPATTTSTTGVMMGLAGSITPVQSGKILITISGDIDNNTAADGAQIKIRTGTGSAPANGAALTGTTQGTLVKYLNPNMAGALDPTTVGRVPFSVIAVVTGLTVNTALWIDLSLASITGGTSRIRDVSISTIEL